MNYPVISADSHITEHPDTYVAHIDAAWKDKAPKMVDGGERGDVFVIDGMDSPIPMGLVAAGGKPPEELNMAGVKFEDLHRGGWDPTARLADQDTDGIAAEIIYPTVGMLLCNHRDFDYKKACFDAYNRWIAEYCASNSKRLLGCGQTAILGGSRTRTLSDRILNPARLPIPPQGLSLLVSRHREYLVYRRCLSTVQQPTHCQ